MGAHEAQLKKSCPVKIKIVPREPYWAQYGKPAPKSLITKTSKKYFRSVKFSCSQNRDQALSSQIRDQLITKATSLLNLIVNYLKIKTLKDQACLFFFEKRRCSLTELKLFSVEFYFKK